MREARYQTSFTRAALLPLESLRIAEIYLDKKDWAEVRAHVVGENLLQARTQSTLQKLYQELAGRLTRLTEEELEFLCDTNYQQQRYLLWLAACRRYRLIADFATEMLHEHYITLKSHLTREDFDIFLSRKAEWHDEIDALSDSTRGKIRQVIFRMLREAELLGEDFRIYPALMSPALIQLLYQHNPRELAFFPIYEADVQRIMR